MKILFIFLITIGILNGSIDLEMKSLKIYDTTKDTAIIPIGNLKIGQSGIIVHNNLTYDSLIIATASVIDTTNSSSTIEITKDNVLEQNAISTSNLKIQNGDKFILNHLYQTSLLIVPNFETKKLLQSNYSSVNFLNEDFFASHLKLLNTPIPTKRTIQVFCKDNQIGTVFIVDVITFNVIYTEKLNIKDRKIKVPFYSKVENINQNIFDFSDDEIKDYSKYYKKLLGIK